MSNVKQEQLAKRLQAYAKPRYEEGYDIFIECGMEYCLNFIGDTGTWSEVKDMAKTIVAVREERMGW